MRFRTTVQLRVPQVHHHGTWVLHRPTEERKLDALDTFRVGTRWTQSDDAPDSALNASNRRPRRSWRGSPWCARGRRKRDSDETSRARQCRGGSQAPAGRRSRCHDAILFCLEY